MIIFFSPSDLYPLRVIIEIFFVLSSMKQMRDIFLFCFYQFESFSLFFFGIFQLHPVSVGAYKILVNVWLRSTCQLARWTLSSWLIHWFIFVIKEEIIKLIKIGL